MSRRVAGSWFIWFISFNQKNQTNQNNQPTPAHSSPLYLAISGGLQKGECVAYNFDPLGLNLLRDLPLAW